MTLSELISVENIAESIKETLMAEACMYRKKKKVVKENDDDTDRAMGFDRGFRHFKHSEQEHELRHDWKPKKKSAPDKSGPHAVHIDGKKWKSFSSHSHATNVGNKLANKGKKVSVHKEEVEQISEAPRKSPRTKFANRLKSITQRLDAAVAKNKAASDAAAEKRASEKKED